MPQANNYCADCQTHFNASVEQHAETYHNDGIFRGIVDGSYKDWTGNTFSGGR